MKKILRSPAAPTLWGFCGLVVLGGCAAGTAPTKTFADLPGTYTGYGTVTIQGRSMDTSGTLEIRPDQTYTFDHRFAMAGPESGTWSREGDRLTTTHVPNLKPAAGRGALLGEALKSGIPPRSWSIGPGHATLTFDDGTMRLELRRKE